MSTDLSLQFFWETIKCGGNKQRYFCRRIVDQRSGRLRRDDGKERLKNDEYTKKSSYLNNNKNQDRRKDSVPDNTLWYGELDASKK